MTTKPDRQAEGLPQAHVEWRAWMILGAATIGMGMGFGVTSSFSVFMGPLEQSFGWSRAELSFAYTLMTVGMAAGGLLWGRLADTRYLRAVVILGALVLGLGLVLAARIHTSTELHAISFILGAAGFACMFTPLATVVGLWFERRRGLAIGILTAGGALGQGLVPLAMEGAIASLGWRGAYLWTGIVYLMTLVPLMALIRTPADMTSGARPSARGAPGWELSPRASTAWLSMAAFFCCFCMAVPLVHVVSVVCHQGHAPAVGAGVLFTMMAAGAVGRIAIGLLADRFGALPAYMLASVIQTATVFWFVATPEMAIIIPLAVVFGFGFAGNMTSLILAVREAVPASHVGRSTGIVGMIAWLGMGAGGYVSGWLYDVTGSYAASFALAAAAGAANLVTLIVLAHVRSAPPVPHAGHVAPSVSGLMVGWGTRIRT
jgi:MFS family permease